VTDYGYVPPHMLSEALWQQVRPLLDSAAASDTDIDEVRDGIDSGLYELWLARRGGATRTAIVCTWQDGDCVIWLAAGDLADLPILPIIEDESRRRGARNIWLNGRPGWLRVLRSYGYRPAKDCGGTGGSALEKVLQ
jgi:hypothetical protein